MKEKTFTLEIAGWSPVPDFGPAPVLVGIDLAAAATAHTSPDAAARFLVTSLNSGAGRLFTYVHFVSEFAAPVIMGFALWRSRRVPLWLAALFAVGFDVAIAQSAKGPVVIAWMAPWGSR